MWHQELEPFLTLALLIATGAVFYRYRLLDLDFCRRLSRLVVRVSFPVLPFVHVQERHCRRHAAGLGLTVAGLSTSVLLAVTAHFTGRRLGLQGKAFEPSDPLY